MVKYTYFMNRKRMYLDSDVYSSVRKLGIRWDEIESEAMRLKINNHPKPTYNTAAMMVIDKKSPDIAGVLRSKSSVQSNILFSGKRGFVIDNITLMLAMVIMLTIVVVLAAYIESQDSSIQSSTLDTTFKTTFHTSTGGFSGAADIGLVIGLVILLTFLLYTSYNIGTNFSLFLIALIMNITVLFLLPNLENYLVTGFYNNNYALAIASMPATFYIINNYTIFITGISALLLIALFMPKGDAQSY